LPNIRHGDDTLPGTHRPYAVPNLSEYSQVPLPTIIVANLSNIRKRRKRPPFLLRIFQEIRANQLGWQAIDRGVSPWPRIDVDTPRHQCSAFSAIQRSLISGMPIHRHFGAMGSREFTAHRVRPGRGDETTPAVPLAELLKERPQTRGLTNGDGWFRQPLV
jgi:hypothetical protein